MNYVYKDKVRLAYEANKKRLRVEATLVFDAVLNEALDIMTSQFNDALNDGDLLEIHTDRAEILTIMRTSVRRLLKEANAG